MDSHHIGPHTVDRFEDWQAGRNLSAATIKRRRVALSGLAAFARGDPITAELVEDWLASKLSAATRAAYRSDVAAYFRWAESRKLAISPMEDVAPVRQPKNLPRPIPVDHLNEALDHSAGTLRTALILGAYAGLRVGEIAPLRGTDLQGTFLLVRGKGDKDRRVPAHPLVVDELSGAPRTWVFRSPLRDRDHVSPETIGSRIQHHFAQLGHTYTALPLAARNAVGPSGGSPRARHSVNHPKPLSEKEHRMREAKRSSERGEAEPIEVAS